MTEHCEQFELNYRKIAVFEKAMNNENQNKLARINRENIATVRDIIIFRPVERLPCSSYCSLRSCSQLTFEF